MNTLIFLGGAGVGAFLACLSLLSAIKLMSRQSSKEKEETRLANQRSIAALEDRNEIGRDQVATLNHIARILCPHRNVTVADISNCDDCGAVVDYDKETKNWK